MEEKSEELIWHCFKNKDRPTLGDVIVINVLILDNISFKDVQGVNTNEGIKFIEPIKYEKGYVSIAWRYKTSDEK